jgi:maltose/moltooligosaccharide transporter
VGPRKPYFLIGAIGCSICLFLFPFVAAIWTAVLLLWILDASNNTAMEPYRAFIADKLPPSQLAKGFLAQSFFTGFGITLANVSLYIFQSFITGATSAGIPYWVVGSFMVGSVCSIATVLVSILSTPEIPPSDEELAAMRAKKGGLGSTVKEIFDAIVDMPVELRKLALVYLFQWYAMQCYWQFVSLSIAESVYGVTPRTPVTGTRCRGPGSSTAGTTSSRSVWRSRSSRWLGGVAPSGCTSSACRVRQWVW